MPLLQLYDAFGFVQYGDFRFPPQTNIVFSSTPITDSAGRVTKYEKCTLQIEGIFAWETFGAADYGTNNATAINTQALTSNSDNLDSALVALRCYLKTPGRKILVTKQGVGRINHTGKLGIDRTGGASGISGLTHDPAFGPHPGQLNLTPIAGGIAARFTWSVEWTQLCCDEAVGRTQPAAMGEFNYTVQYSYDEAGMLSRTISGNAEGAVLRVDTGIDKNIDTAFRETITAYFPIPEGFQRTQHWSISTDKRTIQFSLADNEITSDNPYPRSIRRISIRHRVGTGLKGSGYQQWNSTISGNIELMPGVEKSYAWLVFTSILQTRLREFVRGRDSSNKSAKIIIYSIEIEEEIFGRSLTFSVGYTLTTSLETLLAASGLFRKYSDTDWGKYTTDLEKWEGPFGFSQLKWDHKSEVLIDFCYSQVPRVARATRRKGPEDQNREEQKETGVLDGWLAYDNKIRVYYRSDSVMSQAAAKKATEQLKVPKDVKYAPVKDGVRVSETYVSSSYPRSTPEEKKQTKNPLGKVVERSPGQYTINMYGYGVRAGTPIPIPSIIKIGESDTPPVLASSEITPSAIIRTTPEGIPIYAAKWSLTYYADATKGEIKYKDVPEDFSNKTPETKPKSKI